MKPLECEKARRSRAFLRFWHVVKCRRPRRNAQTLKWHPEVAKPWTMRIVLILWHFRDGRECPWIEPVKMRVRGVYVHTLSRRCLGQWKRVLADGLRTRNADLG